MWAAVPTNRGRLKKLGPVLIDPQMYRGIEVIFLNFTRIQILEVSIREEPACSYSTLEAERRLAFYVIFTLGIRERETHHEYLIT